MPKKEPKMPWGLIPVSAYAQRALTVICPQTPITGDALLRNEKFYPAGKDKTIWSFLPRGHWPLPGQKFQSVFAVRTPPTLAKPWQLLRNRAHAVR